MNLSDTLILCWNFNDAECLKQVGPLLLSASKANQADILVVDGGSSDDSHEVLRTLGIDFVVQKDSGMRNAYQTGFEYAFANSYRYAIVSQSDGNCDFNKLDKLLVPLRENHADLVIGVRYTMFRRRSPDDTFITAFGNTLFAIIYSLVSRSILLDPLVGFRGIRLTTLSQFGLTNPELNYWKIERLLNTSLGWCPLVSLLFGKRKHRIAQVFVEEPKRLSGKPHRQTLRWGAGFLCWAFMVLFY